MRSFSKSQLLEIFFAFKTINGCHPTSIPLKGNYATRATEIVSTAPRDHVWSILAGLFTANSLAINKIDKNKGLLVTAKTSFIPIYTFEDNAGELQRSQAWVVLHKVTNNQKEWKVKSIYSRWNIQIIKTGDGTTKIKVDPIVQCIYYPNMVTSAEVRGQSTGKFEELLKQSLFNRSK